MAISHRATSGAGFATNDNTPSDVPGTVEIGDMLLLLAFGKPYNAGLGILDQLNQPSDWLRIGDTRFTDGTVAAGNDVGSMFVEAWWKEYDGNPETNPKQDELTPTWNVVGGLIIAFSKNAEDTWATPVIVGGGDETAGTGFSVTCNSNPGIVTGDHCVSFAAFRSDAATPCSSHLTPTATGVTFTNTHDPDTDPETTVGGDMGTCITRSTVSGTASAAPVLSATLAASHTGSAALIRLRVTTIERVPYFTPYPQILAH